MKTRIYIDTSIVGGYFDDEFSDDTQALFKLLENKEVIFVISSVLQQELQKSPENARSLLRKYDTGCFEFVQLTKEAIELSEKYVEEKVIGRSNIDDCRHIALATINKADVLASWNFKHIVNFDRIKGYNVVNLKHGYSSLEIRTPKELLKYETN